MNGKSSSVKISVCMATYNGERYIHDQLKSILVQLGEDDEVIVSDDGSTDDTINIINAFNDSRVKIFKNIYQRGYTSNFENSLMNSNGDIIFLSDQDDIWNSKKVELSLLKLKNFDFVVSDCSVVNRNLDIINYSHFKIRNVRRGFARNMLLPRYVGACFCFRRSVLVKSLPFPKNKLLCPHDYWISLIAELYFKVDLINEPLILYRRHNSNSSTGGEKSSNSLMKKISIRIYTITRLFARAWQ